MDARFYSLEALYLLGTIDALNAVPVQHAAFHTETKRAYLLTAHAIATEENQ
jgi:hypothetical protein